MRRAFDHLQRLQRDITPHGLPAVAYRFCQHTVPWYRDGLTFKCTGCAKCCHKPVQAGVTVNAAERLAIAGYMNITRAQLEATCFVPGTNQLATGDDGACVFLRGGQCSIHEVKPTPCAIYPFWNRALWSAVDWNAEGTRCEGIVPARVLADGLGTASADTAHSGSATSAAEDVFLQRFREPHAGAVEAEGLYASEQIVKAMLMNDLHADADETRDGLEDVLQHSVDAEGLAETVSSYAADCRRVVWADDRLAVVDTSLDGSIEAAMRRDVVDLSSPGFTQSTLLMRCGPDGAMRPLHTQLPNDPPVFAVLAASVDVLCALRRDQAASGYAYSERARIEQSAPQQQLRVLVLGAGACAVPAALVAQHPDVAVDAVDIDGGIMSVGRRFFSVEPSERLALYEQDGLQFLRNASVAAYHVIIVDVAASVDQGGAHALKGGGAHTLKGGGAHTLKGGGAHTLQGGARALQAPTAAFLGEDCLDGKAWRALLSSGVLVVNVIGKETHVGHVLDTMRRHAIVSAVALPGQRVLFAQPKPVIVHRSNGQQAAVSDGGSSHAVAEGGGLGATGRNHVQAAVLAAARQSSHTVLQQLRTDDHDDGTLRMGDER